jgi:hypothetical protein
VNKTEARPFFQKTLDVIRQPVQILKRPDIQPYVDEAYSASFRRAYAEGFTVIEGDTETTRVELKLNSNRFTAVWVLRDADRQGNRSVILHLMDTRSNPNPLRRLKISHIDPAVKTDRPVGEFEYGVYEELQGEQILPVTHASDFLDQIAKSKVDWKATCSSMVATKGMIAFEGKQAKIGWAREIGALGIQPINRI